MAIPHGDKMCGLFDRFKKRLGKKDEEPMVAVEEYEGYNWENLKDEPPKSGKIRRENQALLKSTIEKELFKHDA